MSSDPLATPARIAFAGDWHANSHWAIRAVRHLAGRADVIVHLGDFGYDFTASYLKPLNAALAEAGMPLLFVCGNHENFNRLHRWPIGANGLRKLTSHIWHIPRGFRWTWNGVAFMGLGGAHSVDRPHRTAGVSWWPQEWITDEERVMASAGGLADVLVAHDCPAGVMIPGIDDPGRIPPFHPAEIARSNEHRRNLRTVVDVVRPLAIWHGHYHLAYQASPDLGYGPVDVHGLDMDESGFAANLAVVDLIGLRRREGGEADLTTAQP